VGAERHDTHTKIARAKILYTGLSPTTALLLRVEVTGVGRGVGGERGGGRRGDNLRCDHGWSCARLGWSWVRAAAVPPACDLNWD